MIYVWVSSQSYSLFFKIVLTLFNISSCARLHNCRTAPPFIWTFSPGTISRSFRVYDTSSWNTVYRMYTRRRKWWNLQTRYWSLSWHYHRRPIFPGSCARGGGSRGKRGVWSTRRDRDSFQWYWILIARIESDRVAKIFRAFCLTLKDIGRK